MKQHLEALPSETIAADHRIRDHIRETPAEYSFALSALSGAEVFLKLENLQLTGSFKLRGAMNKLLVLRERGVTGPVVTASSGNHGAGVAYALNRLEAEGVVYVPTNASEPKVAAIRRYGVSLQHHGDDCVVAERHARAQAAQTGAAYISPYNDLDVIAGQGTIGVELHRQVGHLDAVFIAIGGGGMTAGIAAYLRTVTPDVEIVVCSPTHSKVMHESLQVGQLLDLPSLPTLSDGTAGGLEAGTITLPLCQQLVSRSVTVSEEQIAIAMRDFLVQHHMLVEGAAGVALAGFLLDPERYRDKRVAIIICGANIALETLRQVIG